MAWQPLSASLSNRPMVLAGPLLRRVTDEHVTVWVALRREATVTLVVQDPGGNKVMIGKRKTVALGTNLHIVAITAKRQPPFAPLKGGIIYTYDLTFEFNANLSHSLTGATESASLAYPPFAKPTFCLPPHDINSLRLIHGSCRIPHGNRIDTLFLLDDLIAQTAENPAMRPHQLFMTGDQIYADDVATGLLAMLTDAATTLLGWQEVLQAPIEQGGVGPPENFPPYVRRPLLEASGLTSVDLDGHLLSLGEYVCMYLFVWSDALWHDNMILFFDEFVGAVKRTCPAGRFPIFEKLAKQHQRTFEAEISNLLVFRNRLKQVRRALANIPSYMIFDDHEVTDDWNMTRAICQKMYGTPLGMSMVQNGLAAYALCQHWGNCPEQFDDSATPTPPGSALLRLLDKGNAATHHSNAAAFAKIVGIHDAATLRTRPDQGLFHDADALTYNYTVEAPTHQVIVTDTRTWRSFPSASTPMPDILTPDQLRKQIGATPALNDRALLIVLSTNAPPIQAIRTATNLAWIANRFEHHPDLYESWEMGSTAFDRLMKAISDKLPLVGGERRGQAMLLSGDVHFSFASHLHFTGTSRFEDPPGSSHPVSAAIVQLVASSFRKQTGSTVGFHRSGHAWGAGAKSILIPPKVVEQFAGWNLFPGLALAVGKIITVRLGPSGDPMTVEVPYTVSRSGTIPLAIWSKTSPPIFIQLSETPHWRYRLEYVLPKQEAAVPTPMPPVPPTPSSGSADDRRKAAKAFNVATGNYRIYDKSRATSREIVGVNNIGEITFEWGAGDDKRVNHTLRWLDEKSAKPVFTTFTVNLNPAQP